MYIGYKEEFFKEKKYNKGITMYSYRFIVKAIFL